MIKLAFILNILLTAGGVAGFEDTQELFATPAKSQGRSCCCWDFAGTSLIESEIYRINGKEYDLSEMWIARHAYYEKAVRYVRHYGSNKYRCGGIHADVVAMIKKYGIVPEEAYEGIRSGENGMYRHTELVDTLRSYLASLVKMKNGTMTPDWEKDIEAILDEHIGPRPEKFVYEGREYTPKSFAKSLGIDFDDYVTVTSFDCYPLNSWVALEIPDNWRWSQVFNTDFETYKNIVDHALSKGYTVGVAADFSDPTIKGQTRNVLNLPPDCPPVTSKLRTESYLNHYNTDDHAVHIIGTAKDENGVEYYKVKDSSGKDGVSGVGCYPYMSKPYLQYKSISMFLHKDALPEGTLERKAQKNVEELKDKVREIVEYAGLPSMQVAYVSPTDTVSFVVVNEKFYAIEGRKQESMPLSTETIYQAASISKPPLAYIALKLVEEGRMDLDKPVYKYYPAMLDLFADKESRKKAKKITAKMILLHTTGLDNKTYKNIVYEGIPGEKYRYSGPGIHILDLAIGHILGKDLRFYSKEYIFDKIGMEHSNYFWQDEYDNTAACGYLANGKWRYSKSWKEANAAYTLRTTAEEYTKFMRWILDGADLSEESYKAMFDEYFVTPNGDYQGLIWRKDKHPELGTIYHHSGNNRCYKGWMGIFPDTEETLCFFTNYETKKEFITPMIAAFMGNEIPLTARKK